MSDICSKEWIWQQYDHTVMGDTIQKPGGDSGVVRVHGTNKAIAASVDSSAVYCWAHPLTGGKQVVAESWRNLISVGATPIAITNCLNFGSPENENNMGEFVECVEGIAEAITRAEKNLAPAEMAHGVALVPEEIFNRRWHMKPGGIAVNPFGSSNDTVRMNPPRNLISRPAGPIDPEVHFVSIRATNGRPIALLANYSLHYVGGLPAGGVSADYFGVFSSLIEKALGKDAGFVGLMSNGTSGDINNINFRVPRPRQKPIQRMTEVAQLVADRVLTTHKTVRFRKDITLAMEQKELTLKNRNPTQKEISYAKAVLAGTAPKPLSGLAEAYAHRTLELANGPREEKIILQALRLGEVGITSIPCEVLCEIGLSLKAKSPLPQTTFTIELANGHSGYLPTPRQHALGGYETWLGTCTLEITASVKIQNELLKMLEKVAQKD